MAYGNTAILILHILSGCCYSTITQLSSGTVQPMIPKIFTIWLFTGKKTKNKKLANPLL